jgi:hypothetical protein
MIDTENARRSLAGVWRLAHLDASGYKLLDLSMEGFWKSFQAAIIAGPLFALLILLRADVHPLSDDPMRALLVETIGYVIGWTAFPLAALYLAKALGKEQRYPGYIVAYNWAQVLQILVFLPVALLSASELLPGLIMTALALGVTAAVLYFQYFICRTALGIDVLPALGFVAMDMMIGILLDTVEMSLHMPAISS